MTGCLVARVAIHEHRAETEFSDLQAAGSALLCAAHEMGRGEGRPVSETGPSDNPLP